jgi:hypothetical protein
MTSPRDLIPKTKFDLDTARAAVSAGFPRVGPILPELLEWLQDYNWPVAQILAPFLASIGDPLVPHLRRIVEGDDGVWKYWIITCIMAESEAVAVTFRSYLERLAKSPTATEAREELDQVAQEVLEVYGWIA